MRVHVRPAVRTDIEAIAPLQVALFQEDAGQHDDRVDIDWPRREGAADLAALIDQPESVLLASLHGDDIVGFLAGYTSIGSATRRGLRSAVLRSLFVAEAHRRGGAATGLVEAFVTWARDHRCAEVVVDHYSANAGAAAFYARHGFLDRSTQRVVRLDRDPPT